METRIYLVNNKRGNEPRLVRAYNRAQALRHVAGDTLTVVVADQESLIQLINGKIEIENAKPEQADLQEELKAVAA
jgi:hypothetical protein